MHVVDLAKDYYTKNTYFIFMIYLKIIVVLGLKFMFINRIKSLAPQKVKSSVHFNTLHLPCFNEYYNIFYPLGKKIVPLNIGEILTPAGLAVWAMDDGTKNSTESVVLLSQHIVLL